jgi:peptidoglycan hydrolase-like protein with peptidoglycan-binding domain
VTDSFFTFEELDWWDEPEPDSVSSPPSLAPPARRRRRQQTRTLAGDIARLRAWAERHSLLPVAVLGGILALVVLVAAAVRPLVFGDEPQERSPRVAVPARQVPVADQITPRALELGDRGERVRGLQTALAVLSMYGGGLDGEFGASTGAAVVAFQAASGLQADGVVGPLTTDALLLALAEQSGLDADVAETGLAAAVEAGRLEPRAAGEARTILAETLEAMRGQSPGKAAILGLVLDDVAAFADAYASSNTTPLFAQLQANIVALQKEAPRSTGPDVLDGTGVVYRFFPQHGYQFHPLASFARLNSLSRRGRADETAQLARALVARGDRDRGALVWTYRFPFGGPSEWTSGFAQATAAQALARAGELLDDRALLEAAAASFRAIPRDLSLQVNGGPWIQEYSFTDMAILNAQLQSILSLSEYATSSGNEEAKAFVASMSAATRRVIGEFDTGCWSRYSLGGSPATTGYHTYHVTLLDYLARTGDAVWRETAQRWRGYLEAGGCG